MDRTRSDRFLNLRRDDRGMVAVPSGEWIVFNTPAIERDIDRTLAALEGQNYVVDASGIGRLDTAGARQLKRLIGNQGAYLNDHQKALVDFVPPDVDRPRAPKRPFFLMEMIVALGARTDSTVRFLYAIFSFIGMVFIRLLKNFRHPRHFRMTSIVRHIHETGMRALPIVGLLSFLMTMVIAYQASIQLQKFGADIFTIDLTTISLLREMGVLITAIMVAGRSGSAFAAEIGVMKLREEVDALKTIGLDPIEVLVLPRVIALLLTLPALTFLADILGLAGGALMCAALLDIPLDQYLLRVESVGTPRMFFIGMVKAPVFAFLIAVIGCYQGMSVSGSAESVGQLTTVAVVQSIFMVILADAIFSIIFAKVGL